MGVGCFLVSELRSREISDSSKIEFLVSGSKGDKYLVTFYREGINLNVICTCKAGENGMYCKHRFALMDGDVSNLLSENEDDVLRIKDMMVGTDVEHAYRVMLSAEEVAQKANNELKIAKKSLAKAMYH